MLFLTGVNHVAVVALQKNKPFLLHTVNKFTEFNIQTIECKNTHKNTNGA